MAFANVYQEHLRRTGTVLRSDQEPIEPRGRHAANIREQLEAAIDALADLPPADETAGAVEGADASAFAGRVDEALVWLTAFAWELRTRGR